MKVQRLFLRNVRNIKSLDLDFRDPFTNRPLSRIVLAGANGSGKSTILESVFALLQFAEGYGQGTTYTYGPFEGPAKEAELLFELESGDGSDVLSVMYGRRDSFVGEPEVAEQATVGGMPVNPAAGRLLLSPSDIASSRPRFAHISETAKNASARESDAIGSVLYFSHERFLPSVQQGELAFEPKTYQWAYRYSPNNEWKGSIESYLFSLNYLDLEDRDRKLSARRFTQTTELVNSILESKRIARVEKGRVVIETAKGETHSINDLSSGEKQLTLLLIEILRRIVPGSVILIDEPEISLHMAWQRGLVAALDKIIKQYDAQVIMATHSVEIGSMVLPYEVISLNDLGLPLGKWEPEKEALK